MRQSIIYSKPPTEPEQSELKKLEKEHCKELTSLNSQQQMAVLKGILADNYHMVLGTPGSGKTSTAVALIRILAQMKKKVLVVTHTYPALDHLLLQLKNSNFHHFVRIASSKNQVNPDIQPYLRTTCDFENMA